MVDLIDFAPPTALLAVSCLHFVGDGVVDISSWPDAGGTVPGGYAAVGRHPGT